jgi:hypothetical protein
VFAALVPHLEIVWVISQMTHPRLLETARMFTCAHFRLFPDGLDGCREGDARQDGLHCEVPRLEVPIKRQLAAWRLNFIFFCKLLLQHSINFTGTDNETLRRRTYVIKREAGEQGQVVTGR